MLSAGVQRPAAALAAIAIAGQARAHAGTASEGAGTAEILTVIVPLLLAAAVYARGIAKQRDLVARRGGWRARVVAFAAGVLVLGIALLPPVDRISAEIASGHMVQHILLMVVAPALIVLAAPGPILLNGLPRRLRRLSARTGHSVLGRSWRAVFRPAVAGSLIGIALWAWHVPAAYDLAVANELVHWAEHLTFVAAGLLFWSVLAGTGRSAERGMAGPLFLLAAMMQASVLALAMIMADTPWYNAYLETAHHWGLDALGDQRLAGAIMWTAGGMAFLAAGLAFLVRWLIDLERSYPSKRPAPRTLTSVAVLALIVLAGCDEADTEDDVGWVVPGGNPESGKMMIQFYQCGSCHEIPGIRSADGTIGPPLTRFGKRAFIAGAVPNEPDNLITWILDPQTIEPGTVMPSVGASAPEARDIAAYLYSLR